jgi:hypothetical protein
MLYLPRLGFPVLDDAGIKLHRTVASLPLKNTSRIVVQLRDHATFYRILARLPRAWCPAAWCNCSTRPSSPSPHPPPRAIPPPPPPPPPPSSCRTCSERRVGALLCRPPSSPRLPDHRARRPVHCTPFRYRLSLSIFIIIL